jgi:hypothetical protein
MDDSLADILGIIVDGGTVVYVSYKAGRWMVENREKLIRRHMIPVGKDLDLRWRVEAPVRPVVELVGTLEARANMSGVLSVTYPKEKPPAWEELIWWYLRVR